MKKLGLLTLALLAIACNDTSKKNDGYNIEGTATGVYNGVRAYLNVADERGYQIPQDTAVIMNGAFTFKGKVDEPTMWFLKVDNIQGSVPVMIENDAIKIVFNKDSIANSEVTGTKSNEDLANYNSDYKKLVSKRIKYNNDIRLRSNTDSIENQRRSAEFNSLNEELKTYPFEFIKNHPDSYFSLVLIQNLIKNNPDLSTEIEIAFEGLNPDIKSSINAQMIRRDIVLLKKKNDALALLEIGGKAPDFTAPTPDGKKLSLNNIKGKATIIDFWASWCGPCRRENPNVVKVYNKYHGKGLEIISVSLDRPGQKEKWLKAIEDDKLTWHHVSNLNYFNDAVAKQYNIQAIPATFILDADGKIVAKGLRGQALEDKIAELLK